MNCGIKNSKGLYLTYPNSFSDCLLITKVLYNKFKLEAVVLSTGSPSKYGIVIKKESLIKLKCIVSPFILKEMKYKLILDNYSFAKTISHSSSSPKPIHPWFI